MLERIPYLPSPAPGIAQWPGGVGYLDSGLTREEIWKTSSKSDAYYDWKRRFSFDNGKTWSLTETIPDVTVDTSAGGIVTYPAPPQRDENTGIEYRFIMRRLWPGRKVYTYNWNTMGHDLIDYTFVRESGGPDILLRYEDGPDFNPDAPFDPTFLTRNGAYLGQSATFSADGTAFFPVRSSSLQDKHIPQDKGVCLMHRDLQSGDWTASNFQTVDTDVSSRGLLEPDAAVLSNGDVLLICRGSNTPSTPGRKWMSVSTDGGKTLLPIEELRYDDGSRFYSPSSIHRFIRSTRNGKLYWIANIVPEPPQGNGPRYPLCIAEIDEAKVAVRKDSVMVLDDRRAGEPETLQLSNFYLLEDRVTLNIEIYMTLLGLDPDDFWGAGVFKYIFSPPAL